MNNRCFYSVIKTINQNEYLYIHDSKAVFTSKILESKNRMKYLEKYNLYKKDSYFKKEKFTEDKIKNLIYTEGLQQLILEVTSACNLRCKYCIFSGNYNIMRTHNTISMDFATAKKAIDMYLEMFQTGQDFNPDRTPTIAFYGGEPLLNYKLIKECIEYIERKYRNLKVRYTTTTNGTLLTDEIIHFFKKYDVNILVSLDGPEEEHDRNRVYANGKGTFKDIYRNIEKLNDTFQRPVFTLSVYDYNSDIESISNFYNSSLHKVVCLNTVMVKSIGTNYYNQFSREQIKLFLEKEAILKDQFLKQIVGNYSMMVSYLNRYFMDKCVNCK